MQRLLQQLMAIRRRQNSLHKQKKSALQIDLGIGLLVLTSALWRRLVARTSHDPGSLAPSDGGAESGNY